jgi:NitT/TauT family transport system ATP-binding protein
MNIRVSDIPAKTVGRIDVAHVSISLGEGTDAFEAVRDLNFAVAPGELICVLGPSGCGKSTLLGALAGHLQLTQGQLTVDDQPLLGPSPDRGIVFQQHTLFPWSGSATMSHSGRRCAASARRRGAAPRTKF